MGAIANPAASKAEEGVAHSGNIIEDAIARVRAQVGKGSRLLKES